ncbi:hypothetical protein [Fusibacter sp. 3D3]|uniref:hypothetical protein n=1 Tax=Fusibacter sp. 3D3 TaxID=1048380 RepID=UPI000853896D|nr:hypothetical protein [Fusibacter sp. 3D3]GAU79471.1 conserved domain protein, proline-rich [Fusibacter sp. 3D3]
MIEKIKDILYDLSDIVVSLIIIAVIFVSVSWKISDTLDVNLKETLTGPTVEAETDPPIKVIIPEINPNGISDPLTDTPTDPAGETTDPAEPSSDPASGTPESTGDTPPAGDPVSNTTPESPPPATTPDTINAFEVPDGATGYSIGKKLVSEGYVADVDTFVNRLVALKLDNKLRAGTFKISKSDPLDTIIKVLAGQSR